MLICQFPTIVKKIPCFTLVGKSEQCHFLFVKFFHSLQLPLCCSLFPTTIQRSGLHFSGTLGQGWFGWILSGILKHEDTHVDQLEKVVIRILKEEATAEEQAEFINMSRETTEHPHVLRILGTCYDVLPYLQVCEACEIGDLKSFMLAEWKGNPQKTEG